MISNLWWYPTTYAVFLFIWPFYDYALNHFSDRLFRSYIVVAFVLWSVSTLIPFANLGASNLSGFLLLYAAVVYIKRFDIKFNKHVANTGIALMLIAVASIVCLDLIGIKLGFAANYSCYFLRGNYRPIPLLLSICFFLWALTWRIQSTFINFFGGLTFDVYLIHMYPPIMSWLFTKEFVLESSVLNSWMGIPWALSVTLAIFVSSCLVALSRKAIFQIAMRVCSR